MKKNIHPEYTTVRITCSCGNQINTKSTIGKDFDVEVCSNCHPFYTGKQKVMDSGGRIEGFNKRYGKRFSSTTKTA